MLVSTTLSTYLWFGFFGETVIHKSRDHLRILNVMLDSEQNWNIFSNHSLGVNI